MMIMMTGTIETCKDGEEEEEKTTTSGSGDNLSSFPSCARKDVIGSRKNRIQTDEDGEKKRKRKMGKPQEISAQLTQLTAGCARMHAWVVELHVIISRRV